jgi:hypothetical protein
VQHDRFLGLQQRAHALYRFAVAVHVAYAGEQPVFLDPLGHLFRRRHVDRHRLFDKKGQFARDHQIFDRAVRKRRQHNVYRIRLDLVEHLLGIDIDLALPANLLAARGSRILVKIAPRRKFDVLKIL